MAKINNTQVVVGKTSPLNATAHDWNPSFLDQHPMFQVLAPFARNFVSKHPDWPTLSDYQVYLESGTGQIRSANDVVLQFVPQGPRPHTTEDGYEPRIFLRGEIQTRLRNWHDFFQVLVWRQFPLTKRALNQLHYAAIMQRVTTASPINKRRSPVENALTQFDECGGILLSTSNSLLDNISKHTWKKIFWDQRHATEQNLKCIVFGHALFEKGLSPYIGMTAHCIMLHVDPPLFELAIENLIPQIDKLLSDRLTGGRYLQQPADLQPFPLLGLPGWHPDNDQKSFYDNNQYFRPVRKSEDQFTI